MNQIFQPVQGKNFTHNEQKIIDYITENSREFIHMSIGTLARKTGSSQTTISRLARHCGYAGFKELKAAVLEYLAENNSPADKFTFSMKRSDTSTPEGMLRYQQYCIEKTISFLSSNNMQQAAEELLLAERIYIFAKGASLAMAQLLKFRLSRFGLHLSILPPGSSEIFEEMNFFTSNDLIVIFAFQKMPREAQVLLDYRNKIGCRAILFTSRISETENRENITPLYIYRGEPTEYHSMAAPCAMIDALVLLTGQKAGEAPQQNLSRLYELKEHYKSDIPR